jgi:excisionase family DNA binding protein
VDILSTRAVAEMLGVSEATVKRWSDAGTLRCFRTPGGHRKFRIRDVKSFLADQETEALRAPAVAPPATELTVEQREARQLALAGDVDGLVSFVATQRLQGVTLSSIFDRYIGPAMNDIGEGWFQGKLSAAQEHIASAAVVDMIARVRPLLEKSGRSPRTEGNGRALCACLGEERHDLALRMVGLVLTAEGFRTSMLGANVPAGDLALLLAGSPPELLALSASPHANLEALRADLALVASAAAAVGTRVIVGGSGFERIAPFPSNVARFSSLEELVERLFRPGTQPERQVS